MAAPFTTLTARIDPWVRRALALALLLLAVQSVWMTTGRVRERGRYSGDDIITQNQKRWAAAQAFLSDRLPSGPLGYILVSDKTLVSDDSRTAQYFSSQFVLLPWWLERDLDKASLRWAVVDFLGVSPEGWNPPAGWAVVEHHAGGVAVLRRVQDGEAVAP